MTLPALFMESYHVNDEENGRGGAMYVVLEETEETVLLGIFGLAEEMSYVTYDEENVCIFEAATDKHPEIEKPPFRNIYRVDKGELEEALQTEKYVSGEDIREAWENWSEGDYMHLRIDGEDREFEARDHRLMEYDRREYLQQKASQ